MKLFCATNFDKAEWIGFHDLRNCWKLLHCFGVLLIPLATFANGDPPDYASSTIADLQNAISGRGHVIQSFRIEGWVRAVIREQQMIVLQDDSSVALFQLPLIPDTVRAGKRVEIDGKNCSIVRGLFGICVGSAPVVDNDGNHKLTSKHESVFLEAGFQSIRLACYNHYSVIDVEYEGPDIPRQKVPGKVLWRNAAGIEGLQQGLCFSAYNAGNAERWNQFPDIEKLNPVANGVATNFDFSHNKRSDETALVFSGYINIPRAGVYTFYLESDGASQLWVGHPSVSCTTIASEGMVMPPIETFDQALASRNTHQWVEVEGNVDFAGESQQGLEIELAEFGSQNRLPVTIVKNANSFSENLVHRYIRADGICEFSDNLLHKKLVDIIIPSPEQVQIIFSTSTKTQNYSTPDLLTTAVQVRRLTPDQASRQIPVKIKGVVIADFIDTLVIQDSAGGVLVHINPADLAEKPRVGELWEIEGRTGPGEFSPAVFASKAKYLGDAALPEPIHPTWDQLMNGTLDAEYVELHGVLTAVSSDQITLLTPDGKVMVKSDGSLTLPPMPAWVSNGGTVVGSIVRIRGCFTAKWNPQTREVVGGVCYMCPAVLNVDETAPLDPFLLPTAKVADLLRFDARASVLQRTKVAGQIIYTIPGAYFIQDRRAGARILTDKPVSLPVGDLIEAVGFPKLGGPSPILLESQVRKIGHASLPMPLRISSKELLDRHLDSKLVQVNAVLVNEITDKDELVLELQAGASYFAARLKSNPETSPTLSSGSLLRLTGVYVSSDENSVNANHDPFSLLLNDVADITVLQQPSWWTVRHSITVAAILGGTLGVAFVWITLLQRIVKRRTVQLQTEIEARQKVEQSRVMDEERLRIAQDLHDELGAGLTEMGILGSLAKNPLIPPNDKERYLGQLTESARSLVTGLDEIVWAVNPHYDSVGSLVTYYSLFAQRFLDLAGIACRLQVIEPLPKHPLDSKLRHGIFLAFKEALNNVVRHSHANEVEIKMEVVENQLTISVRDNGCGMKSAAGPGQDGLVGMHERLRQIGGECQISSQPAGGTNVKFQIRLNKLYS